MRRIPSLLALAAALAPAAAAAQTTWVGNLFITAADAAKCKNSSGEVIAAVGDIYTATYRPAGTALGNSADSYLALIGSRSGFFLMVPNNSFRAQVNYGYKAVTSTVNALSGTGAITAWNQTPASPASSTANVNVVTSFTNFWAVTGCTVSARTALTRQP